MEMKKNIKANVMVRVLLCATILVAMCSCSSDEPGSNEFGVSQHYVFPSGNGGTSEIKVKGTGNWVATTDCEWIALTPASGTGTTLITATVEPNHNGEAREGVVKIEDKVSHETRVVTIHQTFSDLSAPTALFFTPAGGTKSFEIASQLSGCEATCYNVGEFVDSLNKADKAAVADWVSVVRNPTNINITANALDTNVCDVKSAVITLKKGAITKKVNIVVADFAEIDTDYAYADKKGFEPLLAKSYVTDLVFGLSSWYSAPTQPFNRGHTMGPADNELHVPFYAKSNGELVESIKPGFYPIEYFFYQTHDVYSCGAYNVAVHPFENDGFIHNTAQLGGVRIYHYTTRAKGTDQDGNEITGVHLHMGTGFITGGIYVEKVNEKDAYIYIYGNHVNLIPINDDLAYSAYKIHFDASILD